MGVIPEEEEMADSKHNDPDTDLWDVGDDPNKIAKTKNEDIHLIEPAAEIHTEKKKANDPPLITDEIVKFKTKEFSGPHATVGFTLSCTKNLGNYESLKAQVSLHMPCEISELEVVNEFVQEWVDDKLDIVVKGIKDNFNLE